VLEKRRKAAKGELKQVWDYKYALVNDVLDKAVAEFRAIVLYERGVDEAEQLAKSCRTDVAAPKLQAILDAFEG
jgi:guanylate kinase